VGHIKRRGCNASFSLIVAQISLRVRDFSRFSRSGFHRRLSGRIHKPALYFLVKVAHPPRSEIHRLKYYSQRVN
jgi:hypothetical protein